MPCSAHSQTPVLMVLRRVIVDSAPCNSAHLRRRLLRTSPCSLQSERCTPAQGAQPQCLGQPQNPAGALFAHLGPCASVDFRPSPHSRRASVSPLLPARGPLRSHQRWNSALAAGARRLTWTGSSAAALTCSCRQLAQHLQLRPARQTGWPAGLTASLLDWAPLVEPTKRAGLLQQLQPGCLTGTHSAGLAAACAARSPQKCQPCQQANHCCVSACPAAPAPHRRASVRTAHVCRTCRPARLLMHIHQNSQWFFGFAMLPVSAA